MTLEEMVIIQKDQVVPCEYCYCPILPKDEIDFETEITGIQTATITVFHAECLKKKKESEGNNGLALD